MHFLTRLGPQARSGMVASKSPSPPPISGLHHQDPPHLWPMLAGASVLVHLGALMMAWPLVLNVARSMVVPSTVTVPVELVTPEQITATSQAANPTNPDSPDEAESPSSDQAIPSQSNAPSSGTPEESDQTSDTTPISAGEDTQGQNDTSPDNSGQGDSGQGDSGQSDSGQDDSGQENSGQEDSGQEDSGQSDSGQGDSGQEDSGQSDSGQSDSGQSDSGGNLPPPPNNSTTPEGSFFVGVEGVSPVPADIPGDRPDEYPQLQPSAASIVLNPRDIEEGCGPMPVSLAGTASLRVAIEADGRVSVATPWPDSSAATEMDRFIACVLPKADIRFIPARTGTRAVPTDMIILDVTLSPG
jgi:hypothetical protein